MVVLDILLIIYNLINSKKEVKILGSKRKNGKKKFEEEEGWDEDVEYDDDEDWEEDWGDFEDLREEFL